jgi:hypothetical protein
MWQAVALIIEYISATDVALRNAVLPPENNNIFKTKMATA